MNNGTGTNNTTNQVVTLELTLEDVNVVLAGLGELPAKASLAVIEKIRSQAVTQLQSSQTDGSAAATTN